VKSEMKWKRFFDRFYWGSSKVLLFYSGFFPKKFENTLSHQNIKIRWVSLHCLIGWQISGESVDYYSYFLIFSIKTKTICYYVLLLQHQKLYDSVRLRHQLSNVENKFDSFLIKEESLSTPSSVQKWEDWKVRCY
jgi:hypothetical protein